MNFLAHLHLADHCRSHLAGNLLADFVRGDPDRMYSREVANGIRLHRFVDSYIDAMPEVLHCRELFSPQTRRVSGIALDIAWDHFLARHWQHYHPLPLTTFVNDARAEVTAYQGTAPEAYHLTMARMWQQQWLLQYQDVSTIQTALERMAGRRPRLYQLAHCPADINRHYDQLEQQFFSIYPQIIAAADQFCARQTDGLT
ncbi:ACP phosphodiesterase [Photobacterium sp. TY1-4]|uniref:acyl carrier protein phosphodiesterase n=1 Tax=Photobacterium sp. TY1-4 TaxID=2899122 RepID=UPI0021C1B676|nr:ACP phosphodiesterase [Photobacterium sp. TY1-4]UXI00729.1 ACP phosphodiesterase [Photobacterium sp. TY1-4]